MIYPDGVKYCISIAINDILCNQNSLKGTLPNNLISLIFYSIQHDQCRHQLIAGHFSLGSHGAKLSTTNSSVNTNALPVLVIGLDKDIVGDILKHSAISGMPKFSGDILQWYHVSGFRKTSILIASQICQNMLL